ncbi:hypothetical protein ACFTSD_22740 [Nocardiaceae bacterium NPDC056970]
MKNRIASAGFVRIVATVATDDQPIDIGAQLHIDDDGTEHRMMLIGNCGGIALEDIPQLYEAFRMAQAELNNADVGAA